MLTSQIKQIYVKNIASIRFLFSLLINGFTFFGIIVWQWNFFTVIYLYWIEEAVRILFSLIENRINYSKNQIFKLKLQLKSRANLTMFFSMRVYFVFIIVRIIAAPNSNVTVDNLFTVSLKT